MGSDIRSMPKRATGVTAAFTDEGQVITESEAGFGSVMLAAKKLTILTRASSELLDDGLVAIGDWLVEEFGAVLADTEDACGFNGDGSGTYGKMIGITTLLADGAHIGGVAAASGHAALSQIDSTDLANLIAALPEQYLLNARWFASSVGLAALVRLGAQSFGSVETPGGVRPLLHLGGVPIAQTGKLPGSGSQTGKVMLLLGDLKAAAILGDRRTLMIKSSAHRYLERDQVVFKATCRFAVIAHNLGDGSKSGAVVGLLGN